MTTRVTTYEQLGHFAKAFGEGRLNLLVVIGRGGLGKTTAIRKATEGRAKVLQGQVSALALYMELFRHRDQPIVIDDVDRLYADPACVRLLKSNGTRQPNCSMPRRFLGNSQHHRPSALSRTTFEPRIPTPRRS